MTVQQHTTSFFSFLLSHKNFWFEKKGFRKFSEFSSLIVNKMFLIAHFSDLCEFTKCTKHFFIMFFVKAWKVFLFEGRKKNFFLQSKEKDGEKKLFFWSTSYLEAEFSSPWFWGKNKNLLLHFVSVNVKIFLTVFLSLRTVLFMFCLCN